MIKMTKKFLTAALSVVMIFSTIQSASAQIEVWEFDDGTRVTRFTNNDFDDMIALYEKYVKEKKEKLFADFQNFVIKAIGIPVGVTAVIGGIAIANKKPTTVANQIGGTALFIAGLASIVVSFYPEYVKRKVEQELTVGEVKTYGWLGVQDICKILRDEKVHIEQIKTDGVERAISEDEMSEVGRIFYRAGGCKQRLLTREAIQKYCYYTLVERPKSVYEGNYRVRYASSFFEGYRSVNMEINDVNLNFRLRTIFRALSEEKLSLIKAYTFSVSEGIKEIDYDVI